MDAKSIMDSVKKYFSPSEFLVSQAEAEASIREGVTFRGTNIIILVIAIFIASLGLNTNSTAVVIGAMLISPLMGPIIGLGLAVGIQDFALLKRSGRNLAAATLFSIITSTIYFLISPVAEGHSELLARTSPTIYDVLIGFFGGAAGIVALASRSKGNVIPGVAIATALMPPLCTVGYGVATMQPHYFLGALYLFLINSVFIGLSTFIGVKLLKYKPVTDPNPQRARTVKRWVYIVAILTLMPSIFLTYNMLRENRFSLDVNNFVEKECHWPETSVVSVNTNWHSNRPSEISLTLIGRTMPRDSLVQALTSRLGYYNLSGTKIAILQGDMTDGVKNADARDIYQTTQSMLASKQAAIDSLQTVIDGGIHTPAGDMLPEVHAAFPGVRDMGLTRVAVALNVADSVRNVSTDTLNVALVTVEGGFPAQERARLERYLAARLKLKSVSVVVMPSTDLPR